MTQQPFVQGRRARPTTSPSVPKWVALKMYDPTFLEATTLTNGKQRITVISPGHTRDNEALITGTVEDLVYRATLVHGDAPLPVLVAELRANPTLRNVPREKLTKRGGEKARSIVVAANNGARVEWLEPPLPVQLRYVEWRGEGRDHPDTAKYIFAGRMLFQFLHEKELMMLSEDVEMRLSELHDYYAEYRKRAWGEPEEGDPSLQWLSPNGLTNLHSNIFGEELDFGDPAMLDRMFDIANWNLHVQDLSPAMKDLQFCRRAEVGRRVANYPDNPNMVVLYGPPMEYFLYGFLKALEPSERKKWTSYEIEVRPHPLGLDHDTLDYTHTPDGILEKAWARMSNFEHDYRSTPGSPLLTDPGYDVHVAGPPWVSSMERYM